MDDRRKKERVFVFKNLEKYALQRWVKVKGDRSPQETVVFDEDLSKNTSDEDDCTNRGLDDEFHRPSCPRVAEEKTKRWEQGEADESRRLLSQISQSIFSGESICSNCNNSRIEEDEETLAEAVCCCCSPNPVDESLNEVLLELAIEAQCSMDDLVEDFGIYVLQQIW